MFLDPSSEGPLQSSTQPMKAAQVFLFSVRAFATKIAIWVRDMRILGDMLRPSRRFLLMMLIIGSSCTMSWGGQSSRSDEDQVCDSSKETCSPGSREQEAMDRFEKWLDKHDLPKNKLKVASIPGYGRGTLATEDLSKGKLYISVPDHLLLGPEKLRADSRLFRSIEKIRDGLGRDFSKKDVFDALLHDQKTRLILLMLYEKNVEKDSLWSEYFDVLPKSVSVPALFNETELSALQGSEVAPAARKLKQEMRHTYDRLREHLFAKDRATFPKKAFTLKEWTWAFTMYDSRVIQLHRGNNQEGNTPTFIPLIDMVNCRESQDKTFIKFNERTQTADMRADVNFAAGEQVFETYGNKSNYEYLLYNGFVMDLNPNECVYIELPKPKNLPKASDFKFCLDPNSPSIPHHLKRWGSMAWKDEPAGKGEARDAVIKLLDSRLQRYATTTDQDDKLLQELRGQGGEHSNVGLALRLRLLEKRALGKARRKLVEREWTCC